VGIGGSATNDGGAGMAQALGYHLLEGRGLELPPGGLALEQLDRIHVGGVHSDWGALEVKVATDVNNPLTGPTGASAIYGPQKGASPALVAKLDRALTRLAAIIRRDLGVVVESLPGAGAAGGLGAGLVAFASARLLPGAEMIMDALNLDQRLKGADLVITGEGRLDSQTARFGKGPASVARHARGMGLPVIGIGGQLADESELRELFDAVEAATPAGMDLERALRQARPLLAEATARAVRRFASER
jgi:glycerate 2-kinase